MYFIAPRNLARLLVNETIHGIPTFSSTPLPLNRSTLGGSANGSKGVKSGTSTLRGGSNAEAGCNLMREALDLILELLTCRAGRGIVMVIAIPFSVDGTDGGNFVSGETDGNARSETSDPSRRIFGSGWEAR